MDGNPDIFVSVASRYHGGDESLQPDARVHNHALKLVLPNEDTALRVVRIKLLNVETSQIESVGTI